MSEGPVPQVPESIAQQIKSIIAAMAPITIILSLISIGVSAFLIILIIRALLKYINSKEIRKEKAETKKTLGEALKQHRTQCNMTQEFVAEAIGVSRQAVSKWESGTADPSTSNLIAIARLFDTPVEELLKNIRQEKQ